MAAPYFLAGCLVVLMEAAAATGRAKNTAVTIMIWATVLLRTPHFVISFPCRCMRFI